MDIALELSSTKKEVFDLIEKVRSLRQEKLDIRQHIKRLEEELKSTIH